MTREAEGGRPARQRSGVEGARPARRGGTPPLQGDEPGGGKGGAPLAPAAVRSIIAGIMLAMFLSALEQTIVAPALPTIGAHLGDAGNLSWVAGAYLLGATAA